MNLAKTLISTAVSISVAGAMGLAFAQSNAESINIKGPSNLTQTQSDAALPCQPGPFNPHLAKDSKSTVRSNGSNPAGCPTVTNNRVQAKAPVAAPVVMRTVANAPAQPAPAPYTPIAQNEPQPAASSYQNDTSRMSTERVARADRN